MTRIDYEAEYNNRARVPEHKEIMAAWARDAETYRRETADNAEFDVAYGPSPRQRYDLFRPAAQKGDALVLFSHGGYWQSLDKSSFSHMARGLNACGVPVAVAGYDLCPDVTVGEIVEQLRALTAALWRRFSAPIVVCGHSAGGHLAACLLATDWPALAPDLPPRVVRAGVAISGLFDLPPLVGTSINDRLGLDADIALALSPLGWPAPAGLSFDAIVGGLEGAEYHRQSRSITEVWGMGGVSTRYEDVAGVNHFTIIAPLAEPGSAMTLRLATLARAHQP